MTNYNTDNQDISKKDNKSQNDFYRQDHRLIYQRHPPLPNSAATVRGVLPR